MSGKNPSPDVCNSNQFIFFKYLPKLRDVLQTSNCQNGLWLADMHGYQLSSPWLNLQPSIFKSCCSHQKLLAHSIRNLTSYRFHFQEVILVKCLICMVKSGRWGSSTLVRNWIRRRKTSCSKPEECSMNLCTIILSTSFSVQMEDPPLTKKGVTGYDAKLYPVVRLQFWRSSENGVPLHCSITPKSTPSQSKSTC